MASIFNRKTEKNVTRAANTVKEYIKRGNQLHNLARRELAEEMPDTVDINRPLTPLQLASWLIKRLERNTLAPSTYRQYKANLVCLFENTRHHESADAIEYLKEHINKGQRQPVKRTSARKAKNITLENLNKLCAWLNNSKSKHSHLAVMWITATYYFGLRPCEWRTASIGLNGDTGEKVLLVQNAKRTNGRSHGQTRTITFNHVDQYTADMVISFLETLHDEMEHSTFDQIYNNLRYAINYATRKCFKLRSKGVSLYTMRHQFLANCKSMMPANEAAALAGHAVDDTVTAHYGKAMYGTPQEGLYANPEEVDRVKLTGKTTRPVSGVDVLLNS